MGKYLDKTGLSHLWDKITALVTANKYTLPAANGSTLGGVKSGGDVTISNGTITVNDDSHNHTIANVDNLQATLNGKAPLASPALTGTPTAPTATSGTNTTQIATTAFVQAAVNSKIAASDALQFKGTIGSSGATVTALPATHEVGWTYKVATAGSYAGQTCEVGDMIICVTAGTTANNAHWTVVQTNINGAVTGPASATDNYVAVFSGTTGKVIKSGGIAIGSLARAADAIVEIGTGSITSASPSGGGMMINLSVPVFYGNDDESTFTATGTVNYPVANSGAYGVVKLGSGTVQTVAANSVSATAGRTYAVQQNSSGQLMVNVPWTNTTYGVATQSANGLMSAADKKKLDGIDPNDIPSYAEVISNIVSVELTSPSRSVVNNIDVPGIALNLKYTDGDGGEHTLEGNLFLPFTAAQGTSFSPVGMGGMMSGSDKVKLDGIATGATADSALSTSEIDEACA